MDIKIVKAENRYLSDCVAALQKSELGRVYFPQEEKAVQAIQEGLSKGEMYAAVNEEGCCVGFLWYILKGAFHSFPYLHIIAVKEEYRSMGIGRKLLQYCEDEVSKSSSRLFLVVADFNPRAKQLYEQIGYQEIGVIPDLYKKGVKECLMMKIL